MIRVQDHRSGQEKRFDWEGLRRYSIDWYRQRGVDLSHAQAVRKD